MNASFPNLADNFAILADGFSLRFTTPVFLYSKQSHHTSEFEDVHWIIDSVVVASDLNNGKVTQISLTSVFLR